MRITAIPHLLAISALLSSLKTGAIPTESRILVALDLSDDKHTRITVSPAVKNPGGTNYSIRRNSNFTHAIGAVTDGDELIIMGDPTAMSRYVLVMFREGGAKYVRVMTRYREARKFLANIKEFLKEPGDSTYRKIQREPIDINLLAQKENNAIKVTDSTHPDSGLPLREFEIQVKMLDQAVIGVVKYGDYTVEDKVSGLIHRKVVWEGGCYYPRIIVKSQYRDAREIETKYEFKVGKLDKFCAYEVKTRPIHISG